MTPTTRTAVVDFDQIEAEVKSFEEAERRRLGLDQQPAEHWADANPQTFTKAQRAHTQILFGGLTLAHDQLVRAALAGLGYDMLPLDVPDTESLRYGKEFGNRAQCNPTYFTVGNLVKHLVHLRDQVGMPVEEIIRTRLFFTAGACGPCRFGTYVTEYRKALRDAGFDGFRVMLFQQQGGLRQATGEDAGLELSPKFFITLLQALIAGDVVNLVGYRIRPYEIEQGSTDRALEECKQILADAFTKRRSVLAALRRSRHRLAQVQVNRLQPKPKVSIIGEFWAMTTEGDGNYKLQRFLEAEGAEVDIQPLTNWLLYNIWEHTFDTKQRLTLRSEDEGNFGLKGTSPRKKLALLALASVALRASFKLYAKAIGLGGYHLPDMDEIATISHQYYDNHLRGGEGHMEVGKLIQSVEQRKAHMMISVKPFGCMPSSGVSDGVQSLVTARHADAIFCAIETTGDGAVNVQSRVLMYLFKAKQKAQQEYDALRQASGRTQQELEAHARKRGYDQSLYYPRHKVAGTASNVLFAVDPHLQVPASPRASAPVAVRRPSTPIGHERVSFKGGVIALTPVASATHQPSSADSHARR
jgi:predicted nucleotide-binding protein (sugar kinase/HSP70/actin superfamily)